MQCNKILKSHCRSNKIKQNSPAFRSADSLLFDLKFPWGPVVILLIGLVIASIMSLYPHNRPIIRSDGIAYSAYLRLFVLHQSLDFDKLIEQEQPYGLTRAPRTGRLANRYPIGTAIAELPFFLVGHIVAKLGKWPADGWSAPYQWSIFAAAFFWLCLGVVGTWIVIATRTSQSAASFALLATTFGTNLLHYVVNEPSMSHIYAFGALASMLLLGDFFWRAPSVKRAFVFGLSLGFLVSIRNYDILFAPVALYPALWRVNRKNVLSFWHVFGIGAFLGVLPHFLSVTYYLGVPWANTYWMVPLNWAYPKLLLVLFSIRKGWFFWTPIAAIGILGLVLGIRTKLRWFCASGMIGLAGVIYIISVWRDPAMGSSFGHRAFVDALPVVALGIALISHHRIMKAAVMVLIVLNLYLTWAYWNGYIPPDETNLRTYLRVVQMPFRALASGTLKEGGGDSSNRDGLAADVKILEVHREAAFLVVTAKVRNTGTALWISDPGFGTVFMAVRPFDNPDCKGTATWEYRVRIAHDNPPGGEMVITARIPASRFTKPFKYVCAEMMSQPVVWFRDLGSLPCTIRLASDMTLPGIKRQGGGKE